jgi:hypothetical protein
MQNYSRRAAFGALNMNMLDSYAALIPLAQKIRIHAPCVPMVSLLLTIMNHTMMESRVRIG